MSDSFYHITEYKRIKLKIRVKNIFIWTCRSAMLSDFCAGIHMDSPQTDDVMKPYLTRM